MVKKVLYCALSIAILLPLFTFSVFADSTIIHDAFANPNGTYIGPIPQLYYNREYGKNINWWYLVPTSTQPYVDAHVSMMGDFSPEDLAFWNAAETGTDRVTQVEFLVDEIEGSTSVTFSIDFTSYENYNAIFDLSTLGYVQFWWQMALKGISEGGGSPNPESVEVRLYGDSNANLDPEGNFPYPINPGGLYEYISMERELQQVGYQLSLGNRFRYTWGAMYGATVTSSSMRSKYITNIVITANFESPVTKCYFYLSDINYRGYDKTGASLDSADAPPLSIGEMDSADAEGDIQTSIDKSYSALNNRIEDLSVQISGGFGDLKNDDMGYEHVATPEVDGGLDAGESLLDTMDQALSDFDSNLNLSFSGLRRWLGNYATVIDAFWNKLPAWITGIVTSVVMFLVIRKVVGR